MIRRIFILATALVVFSHAIPAQSNAVSKFDKTNSAASPKTAGAKVNIERIERDISEVLTLIEDKHYSGENLDYNEIFSSAIDSMLHTLDPHSNYFDAKEFEQFRTTQESRYFGIGATINDIPDKDGNVIATYIKATFEDAPANRAGLRYGDKIVKVNGEPVLGKGFRYVRDRLRGPRGTIANLVVERHGTKELVPIEIIRDAVSTPSIQEAYMLRPEIGYIAMTGGFNRTTFTEFQVAMRGLQSRGMQNLVLDLRGNGGGLVDQARFVANTFLKKGQTIFSQNGRFPNTAREFRADNVQPDKTPIVILVNGGTASASEILAGALQDHDRALIIGENTFGKGLVQYPFMVEYGSMLLLTVAKYKTPSGRLIQKDYSNGALYDYYTGGGSLDEKDKQKSPKGVETTTDTGRKVYGGGGIAPDYEVLPAIVTNAVARRRGKLIPSIYAFSLDLAFGKIPNLARYNADRAIVFDHELGPDEFVIDEDVLREFEEFATKHYGIPKKQIQREKSFVLRYLRTELVTAAYGTQTALQVFNEDYDPQVKMAIESLPDAKALSLR